MSCRGSPTGLDAPPAVSFDDFVAESSSSSSPSSSVNDDNSSSSRRRRQVITGEAPSSWINSLCQAVQMDANQTALDIVAHALSGQPNHHCNSSSSSSSSSLISQQAMRLGLQILAQRILMETSETGSSTTILEDAFTNNHSNNNNASPTMTNTSLPAESVVSSMMDDTNHPTLDIADWNLPSPTPPPPPLLETCIPANDRTARTTTTEDYSHLSVQEGLNLPVEQVCPKTNVVLRRFATGFEAQKFISNSTQVHFFWYAVQGINKGTAPHIYKKFFWRLQGSDHLPGTCPCGGGGGPVAPASSLSPTASRMRGGRGSGGGGGKGGAHRRDPLRDQPVEMLDVETGAILHTFATAEEAHVAVSKSGIGLFGNFKKVLQGDAQFPHSIYKGHMFRVVGSTKLPPPNYYTQSKKKRKKKSVLPWQDYLIPGTTTTTTASDEGDGASPAKRARVEKDSAPAPGMALPSLLLPPTPYDNMANDGSSTAPAAAEAVVGAKDIYDI